MPPPPRAVFGAALVVLAVGGVAACSNTSSSANRRPHPGSATASTVDGVQTVTVDALKTYRFDPSTITVHPGQVRVVLINTEKAGEGGPHNWSLPDLASAYVPNVSAGQTQSVTFTAPAPGRYEFVCTIHRKQGQTGTLVVLPN